MIGRAWDRVKRRPVVSGAVVLAAGAVVGWLAFGYFGIHTLFFDEVVDEPNPFSAGPGPSGLAVDETTEEMAVAMNDAMAEEDRSGDEEVAEAMPDVEITTLVVGDFISRAHGTSGVAKVITDGNQRFLRFEDFETDNGPDLNVYLATGPPDGSPDDFVDLGDLKGNIGNQNYELDPSVDLDTYTTVFVWCVRFGVAFGAAPLGPAS